MRGVRGTKKPVRVVMSLQDDTYSKLLEAMASYRVREYDELLRILLNLKLGSSLRGRVL
jgi:hypothetical protein